MNFAEHPPAADLNAEVAALIASLRRTEQRLEELTAGEVDAVVDRDGRTLLLRHAQEQLRQSDAARQSAILDALPAHIALLDKDGIIVSVNEAWRSFACVDAIQGPGYGIGVNYPELCDSAPPDGAFEAHRTAAGIRTVLGGEAERFSIEYCCKSADEPRWFLMMATPLANDPPRGAVVMHLDVTARKQAEEQLRRLAERLTTTLESITDAFFTVDREWRFTFLNREAERLLGRTRAELIGRVFWREFPDTVNSPFEREYRRAIGENKAVEFEAFYRPLDSLFSVRAYPSEQGLAVYFLDITKGKLAEEALRASEEEFRTLAEAMPQIVWITREDGWNTYLNQQWMAYTGLTEEQSLGYGWNKPFHPEDQQRAWDAWHKAVETDSVYSVEARLRRADGVYRWWLIRGVPLKDKDGSIRKWFGTCTDIHDLKLAGLEITRANGALRESERRFSDLLANVELVSVMLDREARITYCNDYLLRLTGWRHEEVVGRNWFELFLPPELADMKGSFFAALLANRPEVWLHENEILTRAGERRLIRWNNSVLRSAAGDVVGIAGIGEDITERKAADAKIVYLNRVYAMLSGITSLIVRVPNREALFEEACRVAVEAGGFRMAMIVIVDRSSAKLMPMASAGKDEELINDIRAMLSSDERAPGTMVARVIKDKRTIISNDSESDPRVVFGGKYSAAGVRSIIVLPLLVADEATGVLALYASEKNFFQEEEISLLTVLAGDIAFALDHLDKQARLDYLAYYDALTGLANRTLFLERLRQHKRSAVAGKHKLAVFLIDLERFKNINDSLGRPAGDALLQQVAEWLKQHLGGANLLARVGADQFVTVLPHVRQDGDLSRLLEKGMQSLLEYPFHLSDAVFRIAVKVGVALFPDDGEDAETLFKNAEVALKRAKASGDRYLFYTQQMTASVAGKLTLENQLREALDKGQFELYYQPKVSLAGGKLTSAEALIRWNDPRTGLVPPGRFIPVLEETGLIYEAGRWALRQAVTDHLRWRTAGLSAVRIAVNVSPLQLRARGFIDEVRQAISVDPHAADGLELEITENLIMADIKLSITCLQAIRDLGVRIAIDDFGTGFSSLSYLARLPVDTLKIDRSFIIDMTAGAQGLALVGTIINLAHSLKLTVVAEGVETEEQSRLLRLLDCDEMQGFVFSKPVPREDFENRFLAPPAAG